MEPIEYFEKQLDRTDKWLSFAEAKNAALIALNLAMCGVIVKWIGKPEIDPFCVKRLLIADLVLFIISLLIARECKIVCVNRYCMNLLYAPYWGKQR